MCIVSPPLPWYLFSCCCPQKDHCTNVGTANYERHLLTEIIGLRNALKIFVAGLGTDLCRVLDCCCVTDCMTTANIDTWIGALRNVTASDSVHYQSSCYDNLVKNILITKMSSKQVATGTQSTRMHFWHGFRSPVGGNTAVPTGTFSLRGAGIGRLLRGKTHRGRWASYAAHSFHPYKKNWARVIDGNPSLYMCVNHYRLCCVLNSMSSLIRTFFCSLLFFSVQMHQPLL